MSAPAPQRAPELSVTILAIVGFVLGALIASTWSVAHLRYRPAVASQSGATDDATWTARGWDVPDNARWLASVVRVTTDRCGRQFRGSGVIVDGAVLTNRHVVDGASTVRLTTSDGTVINAKAIAVGTDVDLARVDAEDLPPSVPLAEKMPVIARNGLKMAGFPAGHDVSSRVVTISGVQRGLGFPDPARPVRLDVEVVPGESGSAIVDADGRLAGLLYARSDEGGAGLAIGSHELVTAKRRLVPEPFERC